MPEAKLERTEHGLKPQGDGWFVVNAREAVWGDAGELGRATTFEGDPRFEQVGINIGVGEPGMAAGMYHAEDDQEDFLVLSGECLLIVEGQERRLKPWDFFHAPRMTEHAFVGIGDAPCIVVAVGARTKGKRLVYPVNETALKHNAGVRRETTEPREAYEGYSMDPAAYRDGDLP